MHSATRDICSLRFPGGSSESARRYPGWRLVHRARILPTLGPFKPAKVSSAMTRLSTTAPIGTDAPSVLLVIPWSPLYAGGVSTVVRELDAHLPAIGLDTQIAVSDWERTMPWYDDQGVVHLRLGLFSKVGAASFAKALLQGPATLWRLHRFISRTQLKIVNMHYPQLPDLLTLVLLKRSGGWQGRLVVSFHGTDVNTPKSRLEIVLWRFALARSDRITACSSALASDVAATFRLGASQIVTAYNGVDQSVFSPEADTDSAAVQGLPGFYVVSIGNYIPRKGHRILLEAFALIADAYPTLHLVIAGLDAPERTGLLVRAAELRLSSRLHCLVDLAPAEVAAVAARAAVCVQPSLAEPFGLAVIEAAACGVPVAVSAVGGHLEIVEDGVDGLVFPSRDVAACARAVDAVLSNPEASARRATALLAKVRSRFDWTKNARKFVLD